MLEKFTPSVGKILVSIYISLVRSDNEQYINIGMNEIDVKGNFNVSNDLNQIED